MPRLGRKCCQGPLLSQSELGWGETTQKQETSLPETHVTYRRENMPHTDRLHRGQRLSATAAPPSPHPSVRSPGGRWLAREEAAGQNHLEALRTLAVRLQCKHGNPCACGGDQAWLRPWGPKDQSRQVRHVTTPPTDYVHCGFLHTNVGRVLGREGRAGAFPPTEPFVLVSTPTASARLSPTYN